MLKLLSRDLFIASVVRFFNVFTRLLTACSDIIYGLMDRRLCLRNLCIVVLLEPSPYCLLHFQIVKLADYRKELHDYLIGRMNAVAPNLSALVGEVVGARLLSHAGRFVLRRAMGVSMTVPPTVLSACL